MTGNQDCVQMASTREGLANAASTCAMIASSAAATSTDASSTTSNRVTQKRDAEEAILNAPSAKSFSRARSRQDMGISPVCSGKFGFGADGREIELCGPNSFPALTS